LAAKVVVDQAGVVEIEFNRMALTLVIPDFDIQKMHCVAESA
jgi:hypothetical protein